MSGISFRKILVCALVLGALMAAGCARKSAADDAAERGIMLAGNSVDPSTLDPNLATGLSEAKILHALFEGLVGADTKTLAPIPAAAESWEISEDLKTYTFKIREGAKWSDGRPVEAEDFVFSYRRALNPKLGAEYAGMLFILKNARKLNSGKMTDFSKLGARAENGRLVLELERPMAEGFLLAMLSHTVFSPLPRHALEKFGAAESRSAEWTKPGNMVSNGPYTLEYWSVNDKVCVRKNPLYWDRENVLLNGVDFLPIGNINTEESAFAAGQLHLTDSIAPARIAHIRETAPETLLETPWLATYYYILNTRTPALHDPRVRKALGLSIDRRAIISNFLKGPQKPAYSLIPDGCGGYEAQDFQKENIAEARRLMKEAGYENGKYFPKIKISYNTSEQHKPIAEAIQAMWKKNLGVESELYNLSWPAYLHSRRSRDFCVMRASWVADFNAPESFLEMFLSDSGLNHSGFKSADFDAEISRAHNAKGEAERMKALRGAEKILFDSAPIIPIYFYAKVCRISPHLKGYSMNAIDHQNYKGVWLEPQGGAE